MAAAIAPLANAGIGDVDPGYGVNGRFEARRYGAFFVYPPLADGRLLYPAECGYRRTDVNGLPDETFGSGGVQAWPVGLCAQNVWARAADGRLLFALRAENKFAVARLGLDGEPDPTFGSSGLAAIDVPPDSNLSASALAVQPDGKPLLVLVGVNSRDPYTIDRVLLFRLLPDGGRDTTFGDGGSVAVATGPVDAMDGVGLTLLADGRIVVYANPVTRLTQSGKVDVDPPDGQEWSIAALLPGGGAIAWARTSAGYQLAKVRVDGSFDPSFGPSGDGTVSLPSEVDYSSGVSVSPDLRYIFVAWAPRNSDGHWRVSRLRGDGRSAGQLDTGFGEQGTTDLKSTNVSGAIYALADGGAIITTADYAYRLLGRDVPSPGITAVDLYQLGFPTESDGFAALQVVRAAGSDGPIRLRYRTLSESELPQQSGVRYATPGVDFDAVDGVLDWSDGDDGDKIVRIPLRTDQALEGTEQIYVRFEALSPGTWTVPELVAVPINDPRSPPASTGPQGSTGGISSGGGSFGWPGLLLMLAVLARRRLLWIPALLLLTGTAQAQLAPGDVDPSFVYFSPTAREPDSTNAVPSGNGFIIVKSRAPQPPATESTLALTLIDKDGHVIDYLYGTDGTYTNRIRGSVNVATAAIRLSSGSLAFGGFKRVDGSATDSVAAIAKVDGTGALDPAFGDGGVATFDVQGGSDRVGALVELPDGRIAALVWSRQYANVYDCDVTWMVLVLLSPDGQHTDVADARLRDSWVGGCRDSFTMSAGPGGVLLHGSELNVFDGSVGLFPINWRYGPFAFDPGVGLVSTTIDGSRVGIVMPTARPPGELYPPLGTLVGIDEPVTYSKLVLDPPHARFYLGLSTDGGLVAIARFRLDGTLDTGWGNGGAVWIAGAGQGGIEVLGGLATDLRMLDVQDDGSVVVATADGIVRRLAGGTGIAHGSFRFQGDSDYLDVSERASSATIRVERVGGASGAVSVDLAIDNCLPAKDSSCKPRPDDATPGEDFVATMAHLDWPDGDSSARTVILTLLDDKKQEGTEYIRVKLSNPVGGAGVFSGPLLVAINDDDRASGGGSSTPPADGKSHGGGGLAGATPLLLLAGAWSRRRTPGVAKRRTLSARSAG